MRLEFQRLRFLVVEDNRYMRLIIRTMLHGFGSREVYDVDDGQAGLEAFASVKPDIVITDWELPLLDGLEMTRQIRNPDSSADPLVPIIMLTAYGERRRVLEARDAGVSEYLVKPVSAKALYERILGLVATPRPFIKSRHYFGPERRPARPPGPVGPAPGQRLPTEVGSTADGPRRGRDGPP